MENIYKEPSKIMKQAMDLYLDGKIDMAEKYRRQANKLYENACRKYFVEHKDRDKLYGTNRNFGICYHVFENNVINNLSNKKGRLFINKVSNLIKTNPLLKEQFDIYNSFINKKDIQDSEKYINGLIECVKNSDFDKKEIRKANDKLIDVLESDESTNELIDIDENLLRLYEDVEYLMFNKRKVTNVDEYEKIKNRLSEHINKNISDKQFNYDDYINNITEKYQFITDDEIKLLESLVNKNTDKEKLYKEYKQDTLDKIDDVIDTSINEEKSQWENIKSIITEEKYNEQNVVEDILKLIEIQNSL